MIRILLIFTSLAFWGCTSEEHTNKGRLILNEVLVRNNSSTGVVAPDGKQSDYIELYNSGSATLRLHRFFLSDSKTEPAKRNLPIRSIAPGEFAVFYGGSSDNMNDDFLGFSLSSDSASGDMIYLFDSSLQIVDSLDYMIRKESCKKGKAFGRLGDGGTTWVVQKQATPGKPNNK